MAYRDAFQAFFEKSVGINMFFIIPIPWDIYTKLEEANNGNYDIYQVFKLRLEEKSKPFHYLFKSFFVGDGHFFTGSFQ
jgi:hypothetical protein